MSVKRKSSQESCELSYIDWLKLIQSSLLLSDELNLGFFGLRQNHNFTLVFNLRL